LFYFNGTALLNVVLNKLIEGSSEKANFKNT
jgi:hypothetical protein